MFSFNVNINASLKFLWAIEGLLEGTQALGHSEGIRKVLGHSGTWGTQTLKR